MAWLQEPLFEGIGAYVDGKWNEMALSLGFSEADIIRSIMRLHNDGKPFHLDPTYSTGRFWEGLPQPRLKSDIAPQSPDVEEADVRSLPYANDSIDSIMFDPPFVPGSGPSTSGVIRARFGSFRSMGELYEMYAKSLAELYRVLRPGGLLVFKCQDTICGGKQYLTHVKIVNMARFLGFYVKDLFVLGRNTVMFSPNMVNQQHARKNHCYFLVMVKEEPTWKNANY